MILHTKSTNLDAKIATEFLFRRHIYNKLMARNAALSLAVNKNELKRLKHAIRRVVI